MAEVHHLRNPAGRANTLHFFHSSCEIFVCSGEMHRSSLPARRSTSSASSWALIILETDSQTWAKRFWDAEWWRDGSRQTSVLRPFGSCSWGWTEASQPASSLAEVGWHYWPHVFRWMFPLSPGKMFQEAAGWTSSFSYRWEANKKEWGLVFIPVFSETLKTR